jgi:uncharacterized protein (TIGR02996 family)
VSSSSIDGSSAVSPRAEVSCNRAILLAMEAALIAAIVADPHDAGAWLVYRDWLLERDDSRGPWIASARTGALDPCRRFFRSPLRRVTGAARAPRRPARTQCASTPSTPTVTTALMIWFES